MWNVTQKNPLIPLICESYYGNYLKLCTWDQPAFKSVHQHLSFICRSFQWGLMSITTTCTVISSHLWPLGLKCSIRSESLILGLYFDLNGRKLVAFAEFTIVLSKPYSRWDKCNHLCGKTCYSTNIFVWRLIMELLNMSLSKLYLHKLSLV